MKTQQNIKKIRVQVLKAATKEIDPETLWFDTDIEPESLISALVMIFLKISKNIY